MGLAQSKKKAQAECFALLASSTDGHEPSAWFAAINKHARHA